MTQNPSTTPIDFMKYRYVYFMISAVVILPGMIALACGGLKPSVDFTGGSFLEIKPPTNPISDSQVLAAAPTTVKVASVVHTGENTLVIRSNQMTKDQAEAYRYQIASVSAAISGASPAAQLEPVEEVQFQTVGPILGKELIQKTFLAVIIASISIMLYVAYRFKNLKYGVSAILAMLHDSLVLLSVFALLGYFQGVEIDTLFVTAMLTILSFSVHDTIVVYDRIRESSHKYTQVKYYDLINKAVTETMSRSINNSMTIIFMLLALLLFGGVTIRWFAFALLIGTISGTYSSPFVAAPLLLAWDKFFKPPNKSQ